MPIPQALATYIDPTNFDPEDALLGQRTFLAWRFLRFWLRAVRSEQAEHPLHAVTALPDLDSFRQTTPELLAPEAGLLVAPSSMPELLEKTAATLSLPPELHIAFRQLVEQPHAWPCREQIVYFEGQFARDTADELLRRSEFDLFVAVQAATGLQAHEWPTIAGIAKGFVTALIPENPQLQRALVAAQFDRLIDLAIQSVNVPAAIRALERKAKLIGVMSAAEENLERGLQDIIKQMGDAPSIMPSQSTLRRIEARIQESDHDQQSQAS